MLHCTAPARGFFSDLVGQQRGIIRSGADFQTSAYCSSDGNKMIGRNMANAERATGAPRPASGQAERWSNSIFEAINRTYKVGGLALVFLGAGLALFSAASLFERELVPRVVLFSVGFFLIAIVWVYFLLSQVLPAWRTRSAVRKQQRLVDAAQDAGAVLAQVAAGFQSLAFAHASDVAEVLQSVRPKLLGIPFLSEFANRPALVNTEKLALSIVEAGVKAREALAGVQRALAGTDPGELEAYTERLRDLRGWLDQVNSSPSSDNESLEPR
jgi:hypothetical protein